MGKELPSQPVVVGAKFSKLQRKFGQLYFAQAHPLKALQTRQQSIVYLELSLVASRQVPMRNIHPVGRQIDEW